MLMSPDDKLLLARLVKKAKGSLTLDDFSQKTGISKYQLSRIMNGKFKEHPRYSTLEIIADNAENPSVGERIKLFFFSEDKYQKEKYILASYLQPEDNTNENFSAKNIKNNTEKPLLLKKRHRTQKSWDLPAVILKALLDLPCEWTRKLLPCPVTVFVDNYFCIELLGQTEIKKWHFFFLERNPYDYPTYLIGVSSILYDKKESNKDKYSIIIDSERVYNYAEFYRHRKEYPNIIMSIIMVQPDNTLLECCWDTDIEIPKNELNLFKLGK